MPKIKNTCTAHRDLACFITTARMAALIRKTADRFASTIRLSRGGEEVTAASTLNIFMVEADCTLLDPAQTIAALSQNKRPVTELPPLCSTLTISAEGPDAEKAVAAILALLPPGGPKHCVRTECSLPVFLIGPAENGGFRYRCADYDLHHEWEVRP